MRLSPEHIHSIKSTAQAVLGEGVRVMLFGSRVDDHAKGGDVDLLIEVQQPLAEPALMSARIASRISRAMHGRKVDVLLKAPNLQAQPIHEIAARQGGVAVRVAEGQWARLQFLARVTQKECQYLLETDQRLFAQPMTPESVVALGKDGLLAERLDAFVGRFGRLQDNLGDKLLPLLLDAMAEPVGAVMENLDRAEKLGWLRSADTWLEIRKLRNQMVHEYIEDPVVLSSALVAGHAYVPVLLETAKRLVEQIDKLAG